MSQVVICLPNCADPTLNINSAVFQPKSYSFASKRKTRNVPPGVHFIKSNFRMTIVRTFTFHKIQVATLYLQVHVAVLWPADLIDNGIRTFQFYKTRNHSYDSYNLASQRYPSASSKEDLIELKCTL
jgi:hypothetical protein